MANRYTEIRRVMDARDWTTNPDDDWVRQQGLADHETPLYADIEIGGLASIVNTNLLSDPLGTLHGKYVPSPTAEQLADPDFVSEQTAAQAAGEFLALVGVGSRVENVRYSNPAIRADLDQMLDLLVAHCPAMTKDNLGNSRDCAGMMRALGTFTTSIWDWELRAMPGQGAVDQGYLPTTQDIADARALPASGGTA